MNFHELTPAYGRDYKNKTEVQAGWDAGHDFYSPNTSYMNINDHAQYDPTSQVIVRYGGKSSPKLYNIKHKKAK